MSAPSPSNSAQLAALKPVHVHIVDEFNLDASLDAASTMLVSRHLASCNQIRISSSGLHPTLSAHPKLSGEGADEKNEEEEEEEDNNNNVGEDAAAQKGKKKHAPKGKKAATTSSKVKQQQQQISASLTSSAVVGARYGSTTFSELQLVLEWNENTLKRNSLISNGPRNFVQLDRKLAQKSSSSVFGRFDVVFCCSKEVFEGVCSYYSGCSFSQSTKNVINEPQPPHTVFVITFDSKFYKSLSSEESTSKKLSQGALFTSLAVELFDLIHLRHFGDEKENDIPQHVQNSHGQKWKEEFAKSVKQFEQLRRVEVTFKPFVI